MTPTFLICVEYEQGKYILSLRQGLGQSEQSERFIEELKDHIDDTCMDPHKPHTEEEATTNAGNPRDLTKRFNGYLTAKSAGRAFLHSLMNVLLSVPLSIAATWGLSMLAETFINRSDGLIYTTESIVALALSISLLFLLFQKSIPDIFLAIPESCFSHSGHSSRSGFLVADLSFLQVLLCGVSPTSSE